MSEDRTYEMNGERSFEERVFVRFDSIDNRLGSVDARLEILEAKSYDTKPIWERALAEIASLRESMNERFDSVDVRFARVDERFDKLEDSFANLERKFDVLTDDMIELRADQKRVNRRIDKIETEQVKPS